MPLSKFNGDTLSYIRQNFIDRKEKYIGKKAIFLNDFELSIRSGIAAPNYADNQIHHISISTLDYAELDDKISRGIYPKMIVLYFKEPISNESMYKISSKERGNWTDLSRQFYGHLTLKDLNFNDYLKSKQ